DDGQITRGLAIGHGARLEDEPVPSVMGMGKLVDESGLPDAGFADNGDDLAAAVAGERKGSTNLLDLGAAPDEAGQSAGVSRTESRPLTARPGESVDLHGLGQALDRDGPAVRDLNVAFGEV